LINSIVYLNKRCTFVSAIKRNKKLEIMTLTVTNTIDKSTSKQASLKLAKAFIEQEIICMNEEEAGKPKEERHYYTDSDFKITQ